LFLNTADEFFYEPTLTEVLLGPGTIVTADNNTVLTGLNAGSIAVGDHITARGIYSVASGGTTVIDSTGTSSDNTGSVRLMPNEVFGTLVSSATGSLVMDASTIDNWPVAAYDFTGNGATLPVASAFSVNTEGLALPVATAVGDPIWMNGYASPFGTAPPDFLAFALNNETSVQVAGGTLGGGVPTTPGTGICGTGSQVCHPALMQVIWTSPPGSAAPFLTVSTGSFSLNLADPEITSAVIRIGPESIDMKSLPASPLVVPTSLPVTQTFAPRYSWGNPVTATTTQSVASTGTLNASSNFATFIAGVDGLLGKNPAEELVVRGIYDRATNTFTATAIDFVL
jgi:hypothetical protein